MSLSKKKGTKFFKRANNLFLWGTLVCCTGGALDGFRTTFQNAKLPKNGSKNDHCLRREPSLRSELHYLYQKKIIIILRIILQKKCKKYILHFFKVIWNFITFDFGVRFFEGILTSGNILLRAPQDVLRDRFTSNPTIDCDSCKKKMEIPLTMQVEKIKQPTMLN